jgi:hypothetical protein
MLTVLLVCSFFLGAGLIVYVVGMLIGFMVAMVFDTIFRLVGL